MQPSNGHLGTVPPSEFGARYCCNCGHQLDVTSFVQEYWAADTRMFHVWCPICGAACDVTESARVTSLEPAH